VTAVVQGARKRVLDVHLGLTRVLSATSVWQVNLGLNRARGYLSDPYKVFDVRPSQRDALRLLVRGNHHLRDGGQTVRWSWRMYRDDWKVRAHTLGQGQSLVQRLATVDHLFDEADAQGGGRVHTLAQQDHAFGPAFAHQRRQHLRAGATGEQTNSSLRQGELRMLFGHADVGGQRTLQATAHGEAIDGRDRHQSRLGQHLKGDTESLGHVQCLGPVAFGERVEVGAGAEELGTAAGDDQGARGRVGIQRQNGLAQLPQPFQAEGIGRRAAQGDDGGVALALQFDHGDVA